MWLSAPRRNKSGQRGRSETLGIRSASGTKLHPLQRWKWDVAARELVQLDDEGMHREGS